MSSTPTKPACPDCGSTMTIRRRKGQKDTYMCTKCKREEHVH